MSKILVTGANGFIGSHIVEKLLGEGHNVYGFVRQSSDLSLIKEFDIPLYYGDITDPSSLDKAMKGVDVVVHNAGLASDWGDLDLFLKINFNGTQNAVSAAINNGVERFLYMSSTAIHGFGTSHALNENAPMSSPFNYSKSKIASEQWLFDYTSQQEIEAVAIRPGNVYGTRDHTFIEKYIDAIIDGKAGYVNGGRSKTCPTYVENLVDAVHLGCVVKEAAGEAFLITDGLDIDWKTFTEKLCDALDIKKPKMSIPLTLGYPLSYLMEKAYLMVGSNNAPLLTRYRMLNGGTDYYFSIDKAKSTLGYSPKIDIDTALKKTADWYHNKKK